MVSKALSLGLRGLQFLWALLVMALVGNMIASARHGNPAIVNYNMFVAVFGMLSLIYLIGSTIKEDFNHPILTLGLDWLNLLFWFCGAVATAAYLGAHSCSNQGYLVSNFITNGADDMSKRCREAQASTAFLFFGFFCFLASFVISFLSSRGGANLRGLGRISMPRSTPAMSEV